MTHVPSQRSGTEEYAFLQGLVRLLRPKRVLEVGTSDGQATLAMARAMAESPCSAELVTMDIEDLRCDELCSFSGPPRITYYRGDSSSLLPRMLETGERFDLAFIDGGHHYQQVLADWQAVSRLADTVLLHDALQFSGVARVVERIRKSSGWDVTVLDYPGVHLAECSGARRAPGLALATRRRKFSRPDLTDLPGLPTRNSRRAWQRWRPRFTGLLETPILAGDLGEADLEILFHLLWERRPERILHAGHAGSLTTFAFMEYARSKNARFLAWDPSGVFLPQRLQALPPHMAEPLRHMSCAGWQSLERVRLSLAGNWLLWIDLFEDTHDSWFYAHALPQLLHELPAKGGQGVVCLRNFSPPEGSLNTAPLETEDGGADCTLPGCDALCRLLEESGLRLHRARPEAVFGDYVDAGHWVYVSAGS